MSSRTAVLGTRGRIFSGLAVAALLGTGFVQASPSADSAIDPACPPAYPVSGLAADQPVHGLTVTHGTAPAAFTGHVLGVVRDGIEPGVDMIMAELTSTQIDKTGIWQGMSGSPVYAADGRLIGAVSYGLSTGPSPVAGITPAAAMQKLLGAAPTTAAARSTLGQVRDNGRVPISDKQAARVARESGLSARVVSPGFARLPMPMFVSGKVGRLNRAAKVLGMKGVRPFGGTTASAGSAPSVIVPGGNVAATVSYGDLTSGGIGTVTAVCGSQVLAFGHPMNWTGPSLLTMHGADAIYIQSDPTLAGFKVANLTAPAGAIAQDRFVGLLGDIGATPPTTTVSAHVASVAGGSRDGVTRISVPNAMPEIAAFHLLADEDAVNDRIGAGSARVRWTVEGVREDGTPFEFTRVNDYASQFDLTFETIFESYEQLSRVLHNKFEDVTITDVSYRSMLDPDYKALRLATVERKVGGHWTALSRRSDLVARGGTTLHLRAVLHRVEGGARVVQPVDVRVPNVARRTFGFLQIAGGSSFRAPGGAKSFEELIRHLAKSPHNNSVVAQLVVQRRGPAFRLRTTHATDEVVKGQFFTELRIR